MLSYRLFALGVGFGRSDWQWFRVNNVGPRSVLVLGLFVWRLFQPCPERVDAQNPKISLFAKNKVTNRGSIAALLCARYRRL